MELEPVFLSRVPFAFVIAFHILFPAFTIGLASDIAPHKVLWLATKREIYFNISQFRTRIFAVFLDATFLAVLLFDRNWCPPGHIP